MWISIKLNYQLLDIFHTQTTQLMSMTSNNKKTSHSSIKKNATQRCNEVSKVISKSGAPSLKPFLKDATFLTQWVHNIFYVYNVIPFCLSVQKFVVFTGFQIKHNCSCLVCVRI